MKLTRDDVTLGTYLASFRVSAFRLECRQHYDNPTEREWFARYLETGEVPVFTPDNDAWCKLVAEARAAGKAVQRVHLVQEPPSDYVRFELACQRASLDAGEDIRVIAFRNVEARPLGNHGHWGDFWLFDDAIVVRLEYDEAGRFLRPVAASDPAPYRRCRDVAMARAVAFRQYRATLAAG